MPIVKFKLAAGGSTDVEIPTGQSVMSGALDNCVVGIEAICGGMLTCATCHVYVDKDWTERVGGASEYEEDLLEGTASKRLPNSRLSCQIFMSPELDGLTLIIPPTQS